MEQKTDIQAILEKLEGVAPGVPFLALGQTIFWDEPLKVFLAKELQKSGFSRQFIAGIHDSDYFAKVPPSHPFDFYRSQLEKSETVAFSAPDSKYQALGHNDFDTRGLWSAAGEFSALFGAEVVLTLDILQEAGIKVKSLAERYFEELRTWTQAWRWKGIVSMDSSPDIIAFLDVNEVISILEETFDWAAKTSLESLSAEDLLSANERYLALKRALFDPKVIAECGTLSEFYQKQIKWMHQAALTGNLEAKQNSKDILNESLIAVDSTVRMLCFNTKTCLRPRFEILKLFLNPETCEYAKSAYNRSIAGSQIYSLDQFGEGAIPFDVISKTFGRGTVCVLEDHLQILFPKKPHQIGLKEPISTVEALAQCLESEFGSDVALVGKAVTLLSMLGKEYIFVFHQGASGYSQLAQRFHRHLNGFGFSFSVYPILRVKYEAWPALRKLDLVLEMPEPLNRVFNQKNISAKTFAFRYKGVVQEQERLLSRVSELQKREEWLDFLEMKYPQEWREKNQAFQRESQALNEMSQKLKQIQEKKEKILFKINALRTERLATEKIKGDHWRTYLFDQEASPERTKERDAFTQKIQELDKEKKDAEKEWQHLQSEQDQIVKTGRALEAKARSREILLEAELKRLQMMSGAFIGAKTLQKAGCRPCSWWFYLLDGSGKWLEECYRSAEYCIESIL